MNSQRGNLYVVSAPSGAGKTTLVRKIMDLHPHLRFSISYTTRQPREGETDGKDYFFLDTALFERMREADEFLECAEVFGHFYGTGRQQVEDLRNQGHDVLLEIDWQGAQQIRVRQPDCCSIFILPPSLSELERRLRGRGTDSDDAIRNRLSEAVDDMSHWQEFDHVVINDDLEDAISSLQAIMTNQPTDTATDNPVLCKQVEALLAPDSFG
jgi:guanylate kinase